jgi:hypothetical protein
MDLLSDEFKNIIDNEDVFKLLKGLTITYLSQLTDLDVFNIDNLCRRSIENVTLSIFNYYEEINEYYKDLNKLLNNISIDENYNVIFKENDRFQNLKELIAYMEDHPWYIKFHNIYEYYSPLYVIVPSEYDERYVEEDDPTIFFNINVIMYAYNLTRKIKEIKIDKVNVKAALSK